MKCDWCGQENSSRFCSTQCRVMHTRAVSNGEVPETSGSPWVGIGIFALLALVFCIYVHAEAGFILGAFLLLVTSVLMLP